MENVLRIVKNPYFQIENNWFPCRSFFALFLTFLCFSILFAIGVSYTTHTRNIASKKHFNLKSQEEFLSLLALEACVLGRAYVG